MDNTISLVTDTASIALFDPEVFFGFATDWCATPLRDLPEIARGEVAMLSLGGDGVFRVRITDGPLNAEERASG